MFCKRKHFAHSNNSSRAVRRNSSRHPGGHCCGPQIRARFAGIEPVWSQNSGVPEYRPEFTLKPPLELYCNPFSNHNLPRGWVWDRRAANVNSLVTVTVPPVSVTAQNTLYRNTARRNNPVGRLVNSPCHKTFDQRCVPTLANRVGTRRARFAPKLPVFSLFGRFLSDPSGRAPKSPHARRFLMARCYETALSGRICGLSPTVP